MKTGLLLSVARVVVIGSVVGGTAEGWAACVPTKDCATLGYKYTAAQCNGKGVACPFDTTLWSCAASPTLNEDYCCGHESLCKYTGTSHRDDSYCQSLFGMSCYNKCKSDGYPDCKISQESCQASGGYFYATNCGVIETTKGIPLIVEHTCDMPKPAPASGHCCGYFNGCGYNGGTSSSYDRNCQSHYGRSCYAQCKSYGYPDCNDMQDSCRAQGNTSSLQNCFTNDADGYHFGSYLRCEKPEPASIEGYCCGYTNYCGYSGGTSSSYDDFCLLHKKKSCYDYCKYRGYPDCPDMHTNCRASGGTPLAQDCAIFAINDVPAYATKFSCE